MAAVALLLLTAACGREPVGPPLTKAQYERQAGAILREYARLPAGTTFPAGMWKRSDAAADALEGLQAPPEIRDVHAQLVEGFHGITEDDRAVADAMDDGPDEFQAALDRMASSPHGVEAQLALAELKRRGYKLPSLFGVKNVGPSPRFPPA